MLATLTSPTTTTWVDFVSDARALAALARDEPGETGGESVVTDLGDFLVSLAESAAWAASASAGVEVGRQAEGR